MYRDSVLLEAERQKNALGLVEDWAREFSQLLEDDVFATFVQVCHLDKTFSSCTSIQLLTFICAIRFQVFQIY